MPTERLQKIGPRITIGTLALGALCLAGYPIGARQREEGAGAKVSRQATAKDLGLPIYPSSKPYKGKGDESPAANLGLWGGASGFKLVVLKMESSDPPLRVAEFYKKALGKYGNVLDCSHPPATASGLAKNEATKTASSALLTCGDDKPQDGEALFKAGTSQKQHLVSVRPNGKGSLYQLVYLAAWGAEEKK
jgi:hypothetical protein